MDFLSQVTKLEDNREYWFVRTDNGEYYDTFIENEFIGIGWDHITMSDLVEKDETSVKNKIAQNEEKPLDLTTKGGKYSASSIYNKLINFKNLKKGDAVIIPDKGSSDLAFGVIEDNAVYIDNDKGKGCDFRKRRRVKWVAIKDFWELDSKFYWIKKNRHTISNITQYADSIDVVMNVLYEKDGFSHLALHIGLEENINAKKLAKFIDDFTVLAEIINEKYEYSEDIDETAIKLNLQSPGFIEIINKGEKALLLAAFVFITASCGQKDELNGDKKEFYDAVYQENTKLINDLKKNGDTLKTKKDKFDNLFK